MAEYDYINLPSSVQYLWHISTALSCSVTCDVIDQNKWYTHVYLCYSSKLYHINGSPSDIILQMMWYLLIWDNTQPCLDGKIPLVYIYRPVHILELWLSFTVNYYKILYNTSECMPITTWTYKTEQKIKTKCALLFVFKNEFMVSAYAFVNYCACQESTEGAVPWL